MSHGGGDLAGDDTSPHAALGELAEWRNDLRKRITDRLEKLDLSDPDTLQFAVSGMLEAHYKPKELSAVLGPSQTTIGRWAVGQTIPRSGPYRKWLVETLIGVLHGDQPVSEEPDRPKRRQARQNLRTAHR